MPATDGTQPDPFRPPNWRWARSTRLAATNRRPARSDDAGGLSMVP